MYVVAPKQLDFEPKWRPRAAGRCWRIGAKKAVGNLSLSGPRVPLGGKTPPEKRF